MSREGRLAAPGDQEFVFMGEGSDSGVGLPPGGGYGGNIFIFRAFDKKTVWPPGAGRACRAGLAMTGNRPEATCY
jgi:hypothetical protein